MMVDVLRDSGNVIGIQEFRDACVANGFSRHSFYVYLSYSPILERVAPGTYALRGAELDPTLVSQILSQPPPPPAFQDDGWTKDGGVWLGYRVTVNLLDSGVISIPSRIKNLLGERRFELYETDGALVGELVVAATGNCWGLTPFIGRRGVEVDDALVVTIDTELEVAMAQAGTRDLLLSFQEGEGWGPRHFLEEITTPEDEIE